MEQFVIEGGHELNGIVVPSGNKNAALPMLAASLLTDEPVTLHNVPIEEQELAQWLANEKLRLGRVVSARLSDDVDAPKKPWYKKWWVWAAAGAVVAAGAVGGILIADATRDREVDVVVHH